MKYLFFFLIEFIPFFFGILVTRVPFAGAAMSMLQNGKSKIDLIIANITSPDVFKLLQLAVSMEIPTICKLFFSNFGPF